MDLEDIMLNEISQTEEDILCFLICMWNLRQSDSEAEQNGGYQGLGWGWKWRGDGQRQHGFGNARSEIQYIVPIANGTVLYS